MAKLNVSSGKSKMTFDIDITLRDAFNKHCAKLSKKAVAVSASQRLRDLMAADINSTRTSSGSAKK